MRKVLYILGELEDSDLQWLIDAGSLRTVSSNTKIIQEGVAIDSLFILVGGEFTVTKTSREIARLGSGEIVGDMSFLDARPPTATVASVEDGAVYAIPREVLRSKLRDDPPFASRFYRALCLFLANRLGRTNALVGGGNGRTVQSEEEEEEIAPETLELVALAGARFDWFLKRVLAE